MERLVDLTAEPRLPPHDAVGAWAAKFCMWSHSAPALRQWAPVLGDELSVRVEQDARFRRWSAQHGAAAAALAEQVSVFTRAAAEFAGCGYLPGPPRAVTWRPAPEAFDALMDAGMWGAASEVGDGAMLVDAPFGAVAAAMADYPRPWRLAHWLDDARCVLTCDAAVFAFAASALGDVDSATRMLGHEDALVRRYAGALYTRAAGLKRVYTPSPLDAFVPELAATPDGALAMLHCPDLPPTALAKARAFVASRTDADFALQRAAAGASHVQAGSERLSESTVLRSLALCPHAEELRAALQTGLRCRTPPPRFDRLGERSLPSALVARPGSYPSSVGEDWALDLLQYKRLRA